MDLLLLRLDAPLMSFGGPVVDNHGVIQDLPCLSTLVGLLANALGWEHGDAERLQRLQARLRFGVRRDRQGSRLADFQTVDLGQPFLAAGWTTRGAPEGRDGGDAKVGTHIRYRDYLADAVYTVALALEPADETPSLTDLEAALAEPERPLFIGRKCCLPAAPLLLGRIEAESVRAALGRAEPLAKARRDEGPVAAWWPEEEAGGAASRVVAVTDERDWRNQIHVGRRLVRHGLVEIEEVGDGR
jgi:CRISPR system Cascade subunit CasD